MTSYIRFSVLVVALVAFLLVIEDSPCEAQTLTYSAGWVNGKRSPSAEVPFAHHEHMYGGGLVPISDLQSGRNFLCYDVNPLLSTFGPKSPDYPWRTALSHQAKSD